MIKHSNAACLSTRLFDTTKQRDAHAATYIYNWLITVSSFALSRTLVRFDFSKDNSTVVRIYTVALNCKDHTPGFLDLMIMICLVVLVGSKAS